MRHGRRMTQDHFESWAAALRERITHVRKTENVRVHGELLEDMKRYAYARRRDGKGGRTIAKELITARSTVYSWLRNVSSPADKTKSSTPAMMLPVTVKAERANARTFELHGPVGSKIIDLTLEEVATIWRALG